MDSKLLFSALSMRSEELTMDEMLSCQKDGQKSSGHYRDILQDLISKVHKEEQLCENLMATKESYTKETASLLGKIDGRIDLARDLLKEVSEVFFNDHKFLF
uniref:Ovule protein n=1 Tax=Angiostrongylus cantonensis TaxID=6313 RepID=A0A0K0DPC9_ANGCA